MAQVNIIIVGILLFGYAGGFAQVSAPVKVTPATQETISETVSGYGTLSPYPGSDVTISATSPMRVDSILVQPGDVVHKGDLVVKLERNHSVDVEVEKARIKRQQAEVSLARNKRLFKGGAISRVKLEEAQTNYNLAKSEYQMQAKALNYAKQNSELRSSIDGYVSRINTVIGQIADPAKVLVRIVNLKKMVAKVGVEVEDISKVKPEQHAQLELPNLSDSAVYHGTVDKVNREIDPETQLTYLWIALDNPGDTLQPGTFVNANIIVQTDSNAIVIPSSAMLTDSSGAYIFVVQDSTAHKTYIEPGITTPSKVEVLNGVRSDSKVVIEGNYELEDGMKVRWH